ncbi:MAG: hypothetical protein HC898_08200 [Phycisphaerales bacterium]|nr:hypothetical protein [Phycisphaerales bacterium]
MLDANIKTPVSLRPSPGSAADGVDNTGTIMLVAAVRDELKPVIQRLKLQPDRPWFVGQAGSKSIRRIVAGSPVWGLSGRLKFSAPCSKNIGPAM